MVGSDGLQFLVNHRGAVLSLSLGRQTAFEAAELGTLLCVRDWGLVAMRRHAELFALLLRRE